MENTNVEDVRDSTNIGGSRVYKKRWYILAVVALFNMSNSMLWLSFSPVADEAAFFYEKGASSINFFSLVYLIISVPIGFVASWAIDTHGLRSTLLFGTLFNCMGSWIRASSAFDLSSLAVYPVAFAGQCMCAFAQPFAMIAPTKIAAVWFPDTQRATANTLGSMANPLGILLANVISPLIVSSHENLSRNFRIMLIAYTILPSFTFLMTLLGVCQGKPDVSPSTASLSDDNEQSFFSGLLEILKNKQFMLLAFVFASGLAIITAVTSLLEQILCVWGYSNTFAGMCGALMVAFGFVGAALVGVLVDKTHLYEEITKIGYCLAGLFTAFFLVASRFPDQSVAVAASLSLLGLCAFAMYAVSMELAVECTYPVREATSSGFLVILSQALGVVVLLIMPLLAVKPLSSDLRYSICKAEGPTKFKPLNYTNANIFIAIFLTFIAVAFLIFFHTPYKRIEAEKRTKQANG